MARESASEFATAGVGATIGSLIVVQGVAVIVSLYHIITNRFTIPTINRHRAEGLEEGRAEGLEEGLLAGKERANKAWREWLRQRDDANDQGRPFDEPPPDQRDSQ